MPSRVRAPESLFSHFDRVLSIFPAECLVSVPSRFDSAGDKMSLTVGVALLCRIASFVR